MFALFVLFLYVFHQYTSSSMWSLTRFYTEANDSMFYFE